MLRRWIRASINEASRETAPSATDVQSKFREFALNVKGLATQSDLSMKTSKPNCVTWLPQP